MVNKYKEKQAEQSKNNQVSARFA